MATFTSSQKLNMWWRGIWEFSGDAGTQFTIPDNLYDEFNGEFANLIPGLTWVSVTDEVSLPIAEANVTGLATDLAGKAASVHSHAESAITNLVTDLAAKLALTGGTITGAVSFTAASTGGNLSINGGGFANSYDTDLWIAGSIRSNPSNLTQGIYVQHRIAGNANSHVHDAVAAELRLSGISGSTFLNAFEASIVVSAGSNTIPDVRAITTNINFSGTPTGTITAAKLIVAQVIAAPISASITSIYGVYVEAQTAGATNWSVYAPTGNSLFGSVRVSSAAGNANALIALTTDESLRWIIRKSSDAEAGSNAGSNLEILARTDAGGSNFTCLTILRQSGGVRHENVPLGFFATTPVSKQTVTGSRGANAALTSLLTALATYGIITNSTTT